MFILALLIAGLIALVQWRAHARETAANAAYPPIGELLDVNGVTVHAKVQGSGPDLVLLHGASGNMRDFTFDMVDELATRYRVIGGAVALAWGLERPDQTASIVLVSGVSETWPGDLGWQYQLTGSVFGSAVVIPLITAFLPQSFVKASVDGIFAPQSTPDGYIDHIGANLSLRRTSMRANAQQVNGLYPHIEKMIPRYDTLTMPVELIHGTADTIVPLEIHAAVLETQLADATLTTLPGIGHMPQHVERAAVLDAIDRAAARAGLR